MTQMNARDIINSLPSIERELMIIVGTELIKDRELATPPNDEDIIEITERWLKARRDKFREVICGNEKVKHHINEDDTFSLIVEVADLITAYFQGIPVFSLAKLLVVRGIKNLCNDTWD